MSGKVFKDFEFKLWLRFWEERNSQYDSKMSSMELVVYLSYILEEVTGSKHIYFVNFLQFFEISE